MYVCSVILMWVCIPMWIAPLWRNIGKHCPPKPIVFSANTYLHSRYAHPKRTNLFLQSMLMLMLDINIVWYCISYPQGQSHSATHLQQSSTTTVQIPLTKSSGQPSEDYPTHNNNVYYVYTTTNAWEIYIPDAS